MPLDSSITARSDGCHDLTLHGQIHRPHWVAQLFATLLEYQVSVISAHATQLKQGEWKSRFVLDFSKSSAHPGHLDYSALCEKNSNIERSVTLSLRKFGGTSEMKLPKLSRFEIQRRPDQLIELKLEGPEQAGFLASILVKVSGLALFPAALDVITLKGEIRETIVLRGIGEKGPSDAVYQSLERMLRSFIV